MREKLIYRLKKQTHRLCLSVLLAALLTAASPRIFFQKPLAVAWWGSLYPKFCFAEIEKNGDAQSGASRPKIAFYLAKLLDW